MEERWYTLWLNPEPWAVGTAHRGGISPNIGLVAYQNAVREALQDEPKLPPNFRRFEFRFWRRQDRYIDAADHIRQRNQADATNMQKSLEDALQGILFDNDRDVVDIRSIIVDQGVNVEPCILIRAMPSRPLEGYDDIPDGLIQAIYNGRPEVDKAPSRYDDVDELF